MNYQFSKLIIQDVTPSFQYNVKNTGCTLCVNSLQSKKTLPKGLLIMANEFTKDSDTITLEELEQLLDSNADVCLIDVRGYAEHEKFNIGGQCIPLDELSHRLEELDSQQTIILYCAKGIRSNMAAQILRANNFTPVCSVQGGIQHLATF